jgi:hypothetical protein
VLAVSGSSDAGSSAPLVNVYDAVTKDLLYSFDAYEVKFKGGVRVAVADVNGDGVPDIITVPGAGRAATVKVFDGAVMATLVDPQQFVADPSSAILAMISPEASSYKSGLYVAAGDVDGDGFQDIVVSRAHGSPMVRFYSNDGTGTNFTRVRSFAPYSSNVSSGVQVAVADTNDDGIADLVTVPGTGFAAQVKIFTFDTGAVQFDLARQFNGFESTFKNGVSLTAADLDGDGNAEIILGGGTNGNARVRVLNSLGDLLTEFTAFTTNKSAALRIAAISPDGAPTAQLYVTQAIRTNSHEIRLFDPLSASLVDKLFETSADLSGGVNLG